MEGIHLSSAATSVPEAGGARREGRLGRGGNSGGRDEGGVQDSPSGSLRLGRGSRSGLLS